MKILAIVLALTIPGIAIAGFAGSNRSAPCANNCEITTLSADEEDPAWVQCDIALDCVR